MVADDDRWNLIQREREREREWVFFLELTKEWYIGKWKEEGNEKP